MQCEAREVSDERNGGHRLELVVSKENYDWRLARWNEGGEGRKWSSHACCVPEEGPVRAPRPPSPLELGFMISCLHACVRTSGLRLV